MARSELHFDFRVGAPTLLRLYLSVKKDKPFSMAYNQNTCAIVCTRDVLACEGGLLRGLVCYDCDANARECYLHVAQ
jgi:hypothetical protein